MATPVVAVMIGIVSAMFPAAAQAEQGSAERGYRLLLEKPYVPRYFDQGTFDQVWEVWPEPLRTEARQATPERRREMAFTRYGLTPRPDDKSGKPLQFVLDDRGGWVPNCFGCHGGQLDGKPYPGLPNTHYALETMTHDMRAAKTLHLKPWDRVDFGALVMPLGGSIGTTNAVIFGVALGAHRDADLNYLPLSFALDMVHHDMDAPPWWHYKKKKMIYIDGFAEKSHRALMQFALDSDNGPDKFREWESDFRDIHAYLEAVEAPRYPFPIDRELAERGRTVFERTCVECHGTYGERPTYPDRIVPIEQVGTDRVRLDALTRSHREAYRKNWFSRHGQDRVIAEPGGYQAPPLDGVWASAPYFHNGSVPTLWHVLHPDQRPVVWKRTSDSHDTRRVGLEITSWSESPPEVLTKAAQHLYFDTRQFSKSAAGHPFADELAEEEKNAVLEYLKTL